MAVRDLGVRPYAGDRLPASRNRWVLLRLGLRRAWRSWLVKLAVFFFWVPGLTGAVQLWLVAWLIAQNPEMAAAEAPIVPSGAMVSGVLDWTVWLQGFALTLGAGAGLVAGDRSEEALPFFLSKPVTPADYLLGHAAAIGLGVTLLLVANGVLVVGAGLLPTVPPGQRVEAVGLLFPLLIHATLVGLVLGVSSVAVGALGRSRALTVTAWALLFVVPSLLGSLVETLADQPWLLLGSIPALLRVVGDALFKVEPANALRVWHALPVLALLVGGLGLLAHRRIARTEVVA
jgi:hypothetical protein